MALAAPTDAQRANAQSFALAWELRRNAKFPFCPNDLLTTRTPGGRLSYALEPNEVERWARRGAINAGLAVYSYLTAVRRGLLPKAPHDRCEDR